MNVAIPATIGRYQVVRPILQGGMGIVCLARDPAIGRRVAIKMLRESLDSPELRARFAREARSAGQLQHPRIVTIYDVGEDGGRPFIAMEYIEGQTLDQLARERPLPLARKLELIEALCDGLHYAHQAGVVHRDIKPGNIMVDRTGALKILDFGIARLGESEMTQTGDVLGTLNYMAPEQMDGVAVDLRADIFAVGAVLYELLTSRRAFQGDRQSAVIKNILYGEPEPLERLSPDLDPRLGAIVMRCLAKAPSERYSDMSELQRELAAVRRSLGPSAMVPDVLDATVLSGDRPLSPDHTVLMQRWLREAEDELDRGDLTQASVLVERALSMQAASPEARALRRAIDAARRRDRTQEVTPPPDTGRSGTVGDVRRLVWAGTAAIVLVAVGVVFLVQQFAGDTGSAPAAGSPTEAVARPPQPSVPEEPAVPPDTGTPAVPAGDGGATGVGGPAPIVRRPADPPVDPAPPAAPAPLPAPTDVGVQSRTLKVAGPAFSVSFSPSGREVAAGSQGGAVSVWDVSNGQLTQTLQGHVGGVWSLVFSPDARHLASRSGDQTIRLWDVGSGKETARLAGHGGEIWSVAYSPDGRLLASGSADGTVRLWDTTTGAARDTLVGHSGTVSGVAFTPDGRRLVSGGQDRTVRIWDVGDAREILTIAGHSAGLLSVAVSRGGLVAAGAEDGSVRVWSAATAELRWSARAHRGQLWAVAFKPDGSLLATGGADGLVKTWKTASWEEEKTYTATDEVVRGVSFDPRGQWLGAASIDGTIRLWRQ
jgi:tRNA A-37 threonylcarbamoyl transferase component Bud32